MKVALRNAFIQYEVTFYRKIIFKDALKNLIYKKTLIKVILQLQ